MNRTLLTFSLIKVSVKLLQVSSTVLQRLHLRDAIHKAEKWPLTSLRPVTCACLQQYSRYESRTTWRTSSPRGFYTLQITKPFFSIKGQSKTKYLPSAQQEKPRQSTKGCKILDRNNHVAIENISKTLAILIQKRRCLTSEVPFTVNMELLKQSKTKQNKRSLIKPLAVPSLVLSRFRMN